MKAERYIFSVRSVVKRWWEVLKCLSELVLSREKAVGEAVAKVGSHVPKIEAPDRVKADEVFNVRIVVNHPSTPEHSIRWIEVYVYEEGRSFNPIHIARIDLEPGYTVPEIVLKLKLKRNGCIYALAYCNAHGLWESRKEIRVE